MRSLLWALPVAFFFLNPSFACGSAEPPYQYGAAEMRAAIEGNWSLTIVPDGGAATQVTVRIEQSTTSPTAGSRAPPRSLLRAAYACGSRTLVKTAGACADVSQMPLAVSYVSGDTSIASGSLSGTFTVYGLLFAQGSLELMIGPYQILSQVNADGTLGDPHIGPGGTAGMLTVTRP